MDFGLDIVKLVFTLRLERDIFDPFSLFAIRPHFEEAFRICAGCGGDSLRCDHRESCAYHRTFSQTLSSDPAAVKRYQKPSLPFVFHVPVLPPPPNAMATVELGLVLAGTAITMIDDYVSALQIMMASPALSKRIHMSLVKVQCEGSTGGRAPLPVHARVNNGEAISALSLRSLDDGGFLNPDKVTVHIVTPLKLLAEGRPLRQVPFSPFIRALFRRVSSMVYYFGGNEPDWDFKWLAERSGAVETAVEALKWEEKGHRWSGIVGTLTFRGEMTDYHPFLLAGELLGVGKGATFGMGRYLLARPGSSCK